MVGITFFYKFDVTHIVDNLKITAMMINNCWHNKKINESNTAT
jgi:hypothetical protein